jgi:hypothetical protein
MYPFTRPRTRAWSSVPILTAAARLILHGVHVHHTVIVVLPLLFVIFVFLILVSVKLGGALLSRDGTDSCEGAEGGSEEEGEEDAMARRWVNSDANAMRAIPEPKEGTEQGRRERCQRAEQRAPGEPDGREDGLRAEHLLHLPLIHGLQCRRPSSPNVSAPSASTGFAGGAVAAVAMATQAFFLSVVGNRLGEWSCRWTQIGD